MKRSLARNRGCREGPSPERAIGRPPDIRGKKRESQHFCCFSGFSGFASFHSKEGESPGRGEGSERKVIERFFRIACSGYRNATQPRVGNEHGSDRTSRTERTTGQRRTPPNSESDVRQNETAARKKGRRHIQRSGESAKSAFFEGNPEGLISRIRWFIPNNIA